MKKILIVSDNEVLNSIYSANLMAYVGVACEVVTSHVGALEKLNTLHEFSTLLSLCMVDGIDTGLLLYQGLIEEELQIPLIVLGRQSEVPDEVTVVEDCFDIQKIVATIALKMGVSAKEMATAKVPEYYPVSVRLFFSIQKVPCNIYYKTIKNSCDHFILIVSKDRPIWPKIKEYLDDGVVLLYVTSIDRLKIINCATREILLTLQEESPDELSVKSDRVEQGFDAIAAQIFETEEISKEVVELGNKCMNVMMEVVKGVPNIKSLLQILMKNRSGFLYSHSIITGYICEHIIAKMPWGSDAHTDKMKFLLFFHDMYLASIYEKYPDLDYEDKLVLDQRFSDAEKEQVVSHASKAADVIARFPRSPMGVDTIVRQHHGTTNGMGFATIFKDDISPLSKVFIIGEAFTERMLAQIKDKNEKGVDVHLIVEDLLRIFKKHTYKKIINELVSLRI